MNFFQIKENSIICTLCPKGCEIEKGKTGECGVRAFDNSGETVLPYYGVLSALNIDPIEKKPLYHFFPGSNVFSVGFYGCSFQCPFCQNASISQHIPQNPRNDFISPGELVSLVEKNNLSSLAFTYSEPLIHYEYVLEASLEARKKGIKTVLVTNGYINKKPARNLLETIDALNIDLKSFNDNFYKNELGGTLKPVLDFIKLAAESAHIEITTLIIPGKNDSREEMKEISKFIASINPEIPLHISAYYPAFKYTIPPTTKARIKQLVETAKEKLSYVYPGNITSLDSNTYCTNCKSLLVQRTGYNVTKPGISDGKCINCGKAVPFPL